MNGETLIQDWPRGWFTCRICRETREGPRSQKVCNPQQNRMCKPEHVRRLAARLKARKGRKREI